MLFISHAYAFSCVCCISLHRFMSLMHGIFFYRIDAKTEVAYELIAEPVQEPSAGESQPGEVVGQAPEEATNTADLQGKPRSITLTFNLCNVLFKVLHIYI